ncbi:MAG TPA: hypothetical protein ENK46_03135 [Flavobacteriia bacterium]|nr:hypothetical protein [Flavobacteriia bacterium]
MRKGKPMSRRNILPILGSGLLLPFLGFGTTNDRDTFSETATEDEFSTLLKPDGSTVRVKKSTVRKSTVIQKKLSNTSFLNWLHKKH